MAACAKLIFGVTAVLAAWLVVWVLYVEPREFVGNTDFNFDRSELVPDEVKLAWAESVHHKHAKGRSVDKRVV